VPTLRELQAGFSTDLKQDALGALSGVIRHGRAAPNQLMQIYRNNYFLSLTEALRAIFGSTDTLLGEQFFNFAADAYIRKHPSRSGNLHHFGDRFAHFLAAMPETQTLPYLENVARIDWAWHSAFHAADADPVFADALTAFAPEQYSDLRFDLVPSAALFQSEYSVMDIWHYCRRNGDTGESAEMPALQFDEGEQWIAVFRVGLQIKTELLTRSEFVFVQQCASGQPLMVAAQAAMESDSAFDLLQVLQRLFALGIFAQLRLS